jgi:lipopolysaccharide export system permease protein
MRVFERHLLKNLLLATFFITLVLTGIIMLSQSLKFLEIIIQAGSPATTFLKMIGFATPRFLEVILPLSLFGGVLFLYNKMLTDSELVIMRNAGCSPLTLSRPALYLASAACLFMFFMTTWLAPHFLTQLQSIRHVAKAEYSALIFREGVFTSLKNGITVYIRDRGESNSLNGIVVYDSRPENITPILITAQKGQAFSSEDKGQQIIVFQGSRQQYNPETGVLSRLNFDQYSIDIPEAVVPLTNRWKEPSERSFAELLNPNMSNAEDRKNLRDFFVEAHRRITIPILCFTFALVALAFLLTGDTKRRGYGARMATASLTVIVLQSLYLASFNMANNNLMGLAFMYGITFTPILISLFILFKPLSIRIRRAHYVS